MMQVKFLKLALSELKDAKQYYELQQKGLGSRFNQEVKEAIKRIQTYPKAWTIIIDDVRRALLHKFPYSILYSIEKNHILIIAISHQHRKPEYWMERI